MTTPDSLLDGMRNGAWLDSQHFPPVEYAVPGIVPEGFGLIVAPPKAGKSWFVAGIGLACAASGLALGRLQVDQRPVCYWALEDGHRRLQDRFRTLMRGQPIPPEMHVITQATTQLIIPMMLEFLERHANEKPLLIVDTFGRVKPPKPPGADSYQVDYEIGARLKSCVDTTPGASLLVVHHSRKAESTDFVDAVSGTAGIAGSADFLLVLNRKRHSDEAILSITGRDIREAELALRTTDGLWELDGDGIESAARAAEQRRDTAQLSDRTLDVLSLVNSRQETRASDLSTLGIDQAQARVYLNRLADADRIAKVGRGLYRGVTSVATVTNTDPHDGNVTNETQITPPCRECGEPLSTNNQTGVCAECRFLVRQKAVAEAAATLGGHEGVDDDRHPWPDTVSEDAER
jgi:ribosomal protein L37E